MIRAQARPAPTPPWNKGIAPITPESYFSDLVLERGGKVVAPIARSVSGGGGRFTYDFPAFAATASVTLDLVGKANTISCVIAQPVLAQFR